MIKKIKKISKEFTYSRQYIAIILLIIPILLTWHGLNRYSDFKAQQSMLMEQSVLGAKAELSTLLSHLQYMVSIFTADQLKIIQYLAKNPEDDEKIALLNKRAASHFPNYFAITIADEKGEALLGNYDLKVNGPCQAAIREFIAGGYHYNIFIHPHVEAYHIDVMSPWQYQGAKKQKGIFFISIKPAIFGRVLKNAELLGHKLLLIKNDIRGLIEITAEGTRINIKNHNGNFFLSKENRKNIGFSAPVPGTRWNLIDIPDIKLVNNKLYSITIQTIGFIVGFILISLFFLKLIRHEENLHFQSENRHKQTKEKLEHALEFSNVATWEFNLQNKKFIWSEHAEILFKGPAPDTYSKCLDLIHPDYKNNFHLFFEKCVKLDEPQHFESKILLSHSEERWLEISGSLDVSNKTCPIKLLGLIQDITNRKIAEQNHINFELKQKDTLLREVHHRIKNNLQGIMGLLQQHKDKEHLDKEILDHAISQLYSVSLIHGIHGENNDSKIELSALLNRIGDAAFSIRGISYQPCYSLTGNHFINTEDNNTVAIALILNELIFNAIKHTPESLYSKIQINIITLLNDVVIEIRNPGKSLAHDFDFEKGTGLGTGLTLIRSLLPKHGTELKIKQTQQGIVCHLILTPPILDKKHENTRCAKIKSA